MAELSFKQIEDKLNEEFIGPGRKIVFWYDGKCEFIDDIESLSLEDVNVHRLTSNNIFKTKVLLEREDKENNYLIYASFPKPVSRDNHLADTIKYSKEFFADRASLLAIDLGIDEKYKHVIQRNISFFGAKDRTKRFYDLEIASFDENTIEIGILSVLSRSKVVNFEELVRNVLLSGDLKDNKIIEEFKKFGLLESFWKHINYTFSFVDEEANLEKLIISLLLTYTQKELDKPLSSSMNKYLLEKSGTVMAFIDQIRNNIVYRDEFDQLSDRVFTTIGGNKLFDKYLVEDLINLDIFKFVDEKIIYWIVDRLLDENLNSSIDGMDIPEICRFRQNKHFGSSYFDEYQLLRHAFYIISQVNYKAKDDILSIIDSYDKEDYKIDTSYRKFYYYLDRVRDPHIFDSLQVLIESIYTNKYLDVISKEFNERFSYEDVRGKYKLQKDFYKNFIEGNKNTKVVIISDAFRYEVAKELVKKMDRDKKFEIVEIEPQIGVLPSYTRLGMASLLPHRELNMDEGYNVFVDGKACTSLIQRDAILKEAVEDSGSIQYDDLKKLNKEDLREFFVGKSLVYIYHNQIDARGDKANTEDEVFIACKEAIDEIEEIIVRLTNSVSRTNFLVTADHGFIYKRDKTLEWDKIDSFFDKEDMVNKRFIVSENRYSVTGTKSIIVSDVLGGYDKKTITLPITSNIFKAPGGGQNFVHGGSSPQEILVPVVQVKTNRVYRESENVKIALISMLARITSLNISLDFIQQEAISDLVNPVTYKIAFVDETNEIISNQEIYQANSKEKGSFKRIFKLKFALKNQKYSRDKRYYLTAVDTETGIESVRHEVIIDIAFTR